MNLKPIKDHLIVKPASKERETESGLILPDSKEKPGIGEVVAIGNEVSDIEVNNTVFFKKYSPEVVEVEGEEYLILKEADIIALM